MSEELTKGDARLIDVRELAAALRELSPPPPPPGRPKSNRAQIVTAIIAALGLSGLVFQFNSFARSARRAEMEAKQASDRLSDETLNQLYILDIDIKKTLAASAPEIRELIFDDRRGDLFKNLLANPTRENLATIQRVRLICGVYGNLMEYYLAIEKNLTPEVKKEFGSGWESYFRTLAEYSYAIRYHFNKTERFWSKRTMAYIRTGMEKNGETDEDFRGGDVREGGKGAPQKHEGVQVPKGP